MLDLLTEQERKIYGELSNLKGKSGTHSPSPFEVERVISPQKVNVDACFLSNPYATDLFFDKVKNAILEPAFRGYIENYPSQNHSIAKKLSAILDCDERCILACNGAIEGIELLLKEVVQGNIVVNIPTFSSYYEFCEDHRIIFNQLKKEHDYKLCLAELAKLFSQNDVEALILINPNNPDAQMLTMEEVHSLAELCASHHICLIIDESFIHLAPSFSNFKLANHIEIFKRYDNVILIKSMSKDFGIAGIRLGYLIAHKAMIGKILARGKLWNINGLAEYFCDLLSDENFLISYQQGLEQHIKDTQALFRELDALNSAKALPTNTNFVLVELDKNIDPQLFASILLIRHGILVRAANDKIGLSGNYIRIACRRPEENRQVVRAMQELLNQIHR